MCWVQGLLLIISTSIYSNWCNLPPTYYDLNSILLWTSYFSILIHFYDICWWEILIWLNNFCIYLLWKLDRFGWNLADEVSLGKSDRVKFSVSLLQWLQLVIQKTYIFHPVHSTSFWSLTGHQFSPKLAQMINFSVKGVTFPYLVASVNRFVRCCIKFLTFLYQHMVDTQPVVVTQFLLTHNKRLKVDIYIPPLTWTWPAAVYNAKWRTDRRWH